MSADAAMSEKAMSLCRQFEDLRRDGVLRALRIESWGEPAPCPLEPLGRDGSDSLPSPPVLPVDQHYVEFEFPFEFPDEDAEPESVDQSVADHDPLYIQHYLAAVHPRELEGGKGLLRRFEPLARRALGSPSPTTPSPFDEEVRDWLDKLFDRPSIAWGVLHNPGLRTALSPAAAPRRYSRSRSARSRTAGRSCCSSRTR